MNDGRALLCGAESSRSHTRLYAPQLSFSSEHIGSSVMPLPLFYILFLVNLPWSWGTPLSLPAALPRFALHLPLYRRETAPSIRRRAPKQDSIGLGDDIDVCGFIMTVLALLIV